MAEFIPVDPFDIVIFGGTGDLSQRKLLPALWHRYLDEQIPAGSRIIGASRTDLNREGFIEFAKDACSRADQPEQFDSEQWDAFSAMLDYVAMDATKQDADWKSLTKKLAKSGRPRIFYLATTPRIYVATCEQLGNAGLVSSETRVVLEKPIGRDLKTAEDINEGVGRIFREDQIYRIDHYLGKETVQNLLVLRFANMLFEPLWSRNTVDHVQITVAESVGLEDRADYYDGSGAVRDMVQNHLLQLLCLTAMEPPNSLEADDVRTEKIKVLRALRRFTPETATADTVRAQYKQGAVSGEMVQGYIEELPDDKKQSKTETFVAIKTYIDNWRWQGVPFYLRTGKRMQEKKSEIVIRFKAIPHSIFDKASGGSPNKLVVRLQPDEGVNLYMKVKEPGPGGLRIKSLPLNLSWADTFMKRYPDAYERLLMDVVRGNLSLFMRREEVETAWSWVDTLLEAWNDADQSIDQYQAGSDGPTSAAVLLARDKRRWLDETGTTSIR